MKYIYSLFIVSFLIVGCEDLDRQPLNNIGEGAFWKTGQDAENAINGVYHVLADNSMYRDFFIQTDGLTPNMISVYIFSGYLEISENRGWNSASAVPQSFWRKSYEGIVRANQVLANVPDISMDEALKTRIVGEAHFLRALFYFHLTNLWGDVPLITEPQQVGDESFVARNAKAAVVDQVLKDLDIAITNLPTEYSGANLGRVTQGAALGLKSRVHLYQEEYAEVIAAVNEVTQLGYDLLPMDEWTDQFLPAGENNETESMFEVQFTGFTGSNTGSNFNSIGLPDLPGSGGGLYPLENLVSAFEEGDPRQEWSIIFPGEEFAGVIFDPSQQDGNFLATGYLRQKGVIPEPNIGGEGDQNAVVIRYAEMLLNLAEAENELNGPAGAYAPINRIRNRVGLPDLAGGLTQEQMREAIKKERRLELAFEGHYYFDLLRWGSDDMRIAMESVTSMPGHIRTYDPKVMLWPIPQTEIDVNDNLLPQNPGW